MTISGCMGGIARNRRQHGAAQTVRGQGRPGAASVLARAALDGENAGTVKGNSKTAPCHTRTPASGARTPGRAGGVSDGAEGARRQRRLDARHASAVQTCQAMLRTCQCMRQIYSEATWLDQRMNDWSATELAHMRVVMDKNRVEYRKRAHLRQ